MKTISRREFLQQSATVSIGITGVLANPGFVAAQSATPAAGSTATGIVPDGFLRRATQAPGAPVEMAYSTATIPDPTFADDCQIPVYPWAVNCESAFSMVFVSSDLASTPNHVLVQNLLYKSDSAARADFNRIFRSTLDIFSIMVHAKAEPHRSDDPENNIRRFRLTVVNGLNKAMHLEQRGTQIVLVRAGSLDKHPWSTIDHWIEPAFDMATATEKAVATPTATETAVGSIQVGESEWRISYGPIDFHPSVYDNPTCN